MPQLPWHCAPSDMVRATAVVGSCRARSAVGQGRDCGPGCCMQPLCDPSLAAGVNATLRAVASLAGLHPLRNDSLCASHGGNRRLWALHAVLPRLGWFGGDGASAHACRGRHAPARAPLQEWPYDYDDLLAALSHAGTDSLVLAPRGDRVADNDAIDDVRALAAVYLICLTQALGAGHIPGKATRGWEWRACRWAQSLSCAP